MRNCSSFTDRLPADRLAGSFEERADHPRCRDAIATDHDNLALFVSGTSVQLLPLWQLTGYTPRCGPHASADWLLPAFFTSRSIPIEYAFFKQVPYAVQPYPQQ